MLFSCKPEPEKPTVNTASVSDITATTAQSGGEVVSDGGADVTSRGVCWSTNQNPTINDNRTSNGNGVGTFVSTMSDLTPNTTYYVRAYATNSAGTSYGKQVSFTTLEQNDEGNGDDNGNDEGNGDDNGNDEGNDDENGNEDNEEEATLPIVAAAVVAEVTETTAVVNAEVTSDGGAEVTARGVCWGITSNPTIENSYTTDGGGTGNFTSQLSNLVPQTTYYVRAYATNEKGTAYGDEVSFTTLEIPNTINGYEYVDLGLPSGVKWATHNVEASSPSEIGNFFAWGELKPKTEYTEANCQTYDVEIGDISGNPEYDVAAAGWGATWRIPTREEMEELRIYCTWEWTSLDAVPGFKIIGSNGNHIFLPAVGFVFGTDQYYPDQYGYYWTSTVGTDNALGSFCLYFSEGGSGTGWYLRYAGLPIRPVSE